MNFVGREEITAGVKRMSLRVLGCTVCASLLLILGVQTPTHALIPQQTDGPFHLYLPSISSIPSLYFNIVTTAELTQTVVVQLNNEIFYTNDGTVSWHQLPLPFSDKLNYRHIVTLAKRDDPAQPARILVARTPSYLLTGEGSSVVYRSGDFGLTWDKIAFPLNPTCTEHKGFETLTTSPVDPKRLYVSHDTFPCAGGSVSASYTSADGGLNWQPVALDLYQIEPAASNPTRLYLYSRDIDNELYVSESNDAGQSRQRWLQGPGYDVQQVVMDTVLPDWAYALIGHASNPILNNKPVLAIRRSEDFGQNWKYTSPTSCGSSEDDFYFTTTNQLLAQAGTAHMLFLRCRVDAAASTSNATALYRSTDNGDTWQKLADESGQWLARDASHPGHLLWLKQNALWMSSDDGSTWKQVSPEFRTCTNC